MYLLIIYIKRTIECAFIMAHTEVIEGEHTGLVAATENQTEYFQFYILNVIFPHIVLQLSKLLSK